ncbi:MAG: hypothetical protein ABUS79_13490 [Pseudomonadota bacterium]
MTGCGVAGDPTAVSPLTVDGGTGAGQQSHLHGGQVAPSVHAGQPQPQPPLPVPPPPSAGWLIRTHWPVGHGVVKHAI